MFYIASKHGKYKIMAPTENSMALKIKKWPHIFSTSGAIVPTPSFAFLGPASRLLVKDYQPSKFEDDGMINDREIAE